ncbi:MAG: peptide chain release factor N(5)-glutamine methyltransferase [Treponemataceae bacterium]|nr:peptide chain release factor N(5)-glutamine methyltransferase [Treponemataceae bacterium]
MTIAEFRKEQTKQLINSTTPSLDVDCLLCHVLEKNRSWVLAHQDENLDELNLKKLNSFIDQRKTGLPIAYIIEKKEFFGLEFFVNKNVLIPKPDTELLIEKAIEIIEQDFQNRISKVADVCTGSGCVFISIAKQFENTKNIKYFSTDVCHKALEVAKINSQKILGQTFTEENVQFNLADLLDNVTEKFDMIVSNPPYVPRSIVNDLLLDGRREPPLALDGDACYISTTDSNYGDGMSLIRPLIKQSYEQLNDGGFFLIETGEYNAHLTREYLQEIGFSDIITFDDLSGQPRVTRAIKK